MKIGFQSGKSGVALIMVMVAIFALSVLVGAFAYAMKVETKLAQTANNGETLIWLGRSGVEQAKAILAQVNCPLRGAESKMGGRDGIGVRDKRGFYRLADAECSARRRNLFHHHQRFGAQNKPQLGLRGVDPKRR